MVSGADAFAEELDQDTGTADEWLTFCDGGFPSVVRVEDLGCIGSVGVEVAVPSEAATPGVPDAVAVELSIRQCSNVLDDFNVESDFGSLSTPSAL